MRQSASRCSPREREQIAAYKSQSKEAGQRFNRVLGALCRFEVNTGTKPEENLTSRRVRDSSMNGLAHLRMKPWDRLGERRRPVFGERIRVFDTISLSVCQHWSSEQCQAEGCMEEDVLCMC